MKKIKQILLFITVLQSTIHAETTREDVDNYMEVSRGGVIFGNSYKYRYETYFSKMYGYDIKKADKSMIKKYKTFIFSKRYEDIFYKAFTKMDDNSYYEIMAFYKTALGQKYTKAFRELYARDIQDELMLSIMEKKDKILLYNKRKLVGEINKALYEKLYIDFDKHIYIFSNNGGKLRKEYKLPKDKKMKTISEKRKVLLDEYFEVFNEMAYLHFSDDELSQILEYAKTYGKVEMAFFHHALKSNIDAFKKDLDVFLKEKALKENNSTNTKQH